MTAYLVKAPLLVVKDQTGLMRHKYQGAVVPFLDDEQREHFLRHGLVEEVSDSDVKASGVPVAPSKPAKTAPKEAWVEWGVHLGHDRGELDALTKPDLIDLYG